MPFKQYLYKTIMNSLIPELQSLIYRSIHELKFVEVTNELKPYSINPEKFGMKCDLCKDILIMKGKVFTVVEPNKWCDNGESYCFSCYASLDPKPSSTVYTYP